jgi:hypothetical protein
MKNVHECVHACVKGCHGWVDDGVDVLNNVGRFPSDVNSKTYTMRKKLNCFFLLEGFKTVIHLVIYIYEKHGSRPIKVQVPVSPCPEREDTQNGGADQAIQTR